MYHLIKLNINFVNEKCMWNYLHKFIIYATYLD
jgi:hypothetical protein